MAKFPKILCLDTSLDVCSVALQVEDHSTPYYLEERGFNIHSEKITLLIDFVVKEAGIKLQHLDAICVTKGPGSYTGLRIGVSTAKGLCYALNKPLLALNTLQIMVPNAMEMINGEGLLYCPMIDARRMEVYYALFDSPGSFIKDTSAEVINEDFLSDVLARQKVVFFGNGMPKCRDIIEKNKNALFLDNIYPKAGRLIDFAAEKYMAGDFEDIFSFEPFYLKDFFSQQSAVRNSL
jgi:tRNA threonylcarbamoyladenosine biosynthesis protein TsaB